MLQRYFKFVVIVLMMVLLESCGQSTSTQNNVNKVSSPTSTSTSMPTPTATPTPQLEHLIDFTVANLHVHSDIGMQCYNHTPLRYPTEGSNLVLATDRLTYDSGELQQMTDYANAYYKGTSLPPLPNTLNFAPVGSQLSSSNVGWVGCFEEVQLTNVGQAPIQIQSLNVQLISVDQPAPVQYNFIDICSLLTISTSCPPQKGGGGIAYYYFKLQPGSGGTVFNAAQDFKEGNIGLPVPNRLQTLLNQNDSTVVDLLYDSLPGNFIYTVMPNIILNGQSPIPLPQLKDTLHFANNSQFSCYTLVKSTFQKVDLYDSRRMCI